jgi:hypothetical protein
VRIDSGWEGREDGWRQIAVVVDDSPACVAALRRAVAECRVHRSRLTLVAVAPRPWPTVGLSGVCPYRLADEAMASAASLVRGLAGSLPADIGCTTVVRCGWVINEVLGVVRECHCDLVLFAPTPGRALRRLVGRRRVARLRRVVAVGVIAPDSGALAPARALLPAVEPGAELGTASFATAQISAT